MIGPAPMCLYCLHFWSAIGPIDEEDGERTGPTGCAAFPEPPGIPDAIFDNGFDHRKPYAGDHGIRFKAKADTSAEVLAQIERMFTN